MQTDRWSRVKQAFHSALEQPPHQRSAFLSLACANDPSLLPDVQALLEAHATEDSFIEQPAVQRAGLAPPPIDWIGRRFGPYRIVGELERGGMSEVYRAVRDDNQYEKDVAIKILRHGFDSESLLRRFRDERQILARLNHPNIAHLVDGGTTETGKPYLVMEYIRGQSIDSYCEQRQLSIRARIDLVRTLCDAVHYVHQHLMVHGDLKCNNVLVTDLGVLKLLDFGIARLLNPTPALTAGDPAVSSYIALTPDYASPEQLQNEPITTASDVYSLGVVLYRLLAGRLPFHLRSAVTPEQAEQFCDLTPTPPSIAARNGAASYRQLARHLEGDLDHIVLKALSKEPDRRYGSVEQLSEDLLRYLRGFPVRAHPDGTAYRARKFVLRNRATSAAMTLFVVAMSGGIATTTWQTHLADSERARAERHFEDVRRFAHSYMTEVHGAVENLPGSIGARKLLIDTSLRHLSGLAKESNDNPLVRHDLASAYEKIGDIQGRMRGANIGDTEGAIASYRTAVQTRESLLPQHPSADVQRDLLRTHGKLAEVLMVRNEPDAALEHLRRSTQIATALANAPDATGADRRNLANAFLSYGWHCASLDHLEDGIPLMQQSLTLYREVLAADPTDTRARRNLALAHHRLGNTYAERTDRYDEAARHLSEAHSILLEMLSTDSNNSDLSRIHAYTLVALGGAELELGRPEDALRTIEESYRRFEAIRVADQGDFEAPIAVAHSLGRLSEVLLVLNEPRQALQRLTVAQSLLRNQNPSADLDLPETHYYSALVYLQLGKTHARMAQETSSTAHSDHIARARRWLDMTVRSMERAVVDAVHGSRAQARIAEAQALLQSL